MPYNLIEEAWIPIRRADGTTGRIAPWQITDGYSDTARRIVALQSPRPDFDGALVQFLIGLAQTCIAPRDNAEWRGMLNNPPAPETLRKAFAPVAHAFNLDGDGPRFMQEEVCGRRWPVTSLLINAPGEETAQRNADLFVKCNPLGKHITFCRSCTAAALLTMQLMAPGGGRGKNSSLRGIGVLNIMIVGQSLWETIALNLVVNTTLTIDEHAQAGNWHRTFPWLQPHKFIKEKIQRSVSSCDLSPLHVYWSCPRRYWLEFRPAKSGDVCGLCGCRDTVYATSLLDRRDGIAYFRGDGERTVPEWISPLHPLSAYQQENGSPPKAIQTPDSVICFRHWIGLVVSRTTPGKKKTRTIAPSVIDNYRRAAGINPSPIRLWAYGYHIKKTNSIKSWVNSVASIPFVSEEKETLFADMLHRLLQCADVIHDNTLDALARIMFFKPAITTNNTIEWEPKDRAKTKVLAKTQLTRSFSIRFWPALEDDFYRALQCYDAPHPHVEHVKRDYYARSISLAKALLDSFVQSTGLHIEEPRSVALAMKELQGLKRTCYRILSLPTQEKETE